jgi:hypothetical protein
MFDVLKNKTILNKEWDDHILVFRRLGERDLLIHQSLGHEFTCFCLRHALD